MNKAAMNIYIQTFVWLCFYFFIFFGYITRMESLW